jgi:exodeoxyribonuclease-3
MKFISWNVNGFRAVLGKGFVDIFDELDADFFCLQETKMQPGQADFAPEGYHSYWFSAEKKGYSGTTVFTKHEPLSVAYGIDGKHIDEGRVITLEYEDFYLVCVYVPNAQDELKRLDYRMRWEDDFRAYLKRLAATEHEGADGSRFCKGVIVCGDLNVAHKEIDLKNPKTNRKNPGFTDEERGQFTNLLEAGFTDTFRHFYPDQEDIYSWWSYRFQARQKNVGWRIDYFVTSDNLKPRLVDAKIHTEIFGSDHCPVELTIKK